MKKGKYANKRSHRGATNKTLALILSLVLVIGCVAGGTLAWLTANSQTVTNTFTVSDIGIGLVENTGEFYKMVPGDILAKDPQVTVAANSVASWVFVKIEESDNLDTFIDYDVITGATNANLSEGTYWNALSGVEGVYYCKVKETNASTTVTLPVIWYDANGNGTMEDTELNHVKVKEDVTKEMMKALTDATRPTLKFTAYAIQQASFDTAAAAWAEVSK